MLNRMLNMGIGFAWTVRASAFVILLCLVLANILIRPRQKPKHAQSTGLPKVSLAALFQDLPYMLLIIG